MADRSLTDEDIKLIFQHELKQSLGYMGSDLTEQRAEAMKRYLGELYGNEKAGRSQVVSSDVMDTIEWILPSLLRIFASGDEIGRYEPRRPEEAEAAQQATEYLSWVWNSQNEGFKNYYVWFKDALIQKVGTVKIWWEAGETWKREEYSGLDDIAFAELVADQDVEVVEHTELPPASDGAEQAPLHDVVVKRRASGGKVCVEPVPPEEFLVSREAKNIQDARFVAHRTRKTISDLREMGFDEDKIAEIGAGQDGAWNEEEISRSTLDDEAPGDMRDPSIDDSMREVWLEEGYIRADRNGDGIAEMLQVTMAGGVVLKIEDWDGLRPFASLCPIIMPHRFYGLSIADIIDDLQLIKTTLLRQYLDGLYLANNPRLEVKEDRIVDPAEVLDSRPGGVIRTTGEGQSIFPVPLPFVGDTALQGMNYVDQLRENRTGVSPRVQGLGSQALHDTASGENLLMSKAMEKIELIARVFGETGVKDAARLILELVCRYQDQPAMIRLRGKWVQMDPRAWDNEFDFSVNVGLGNGSRDTMVVNLQKLLGLQVQAIQMQGGIGGPLVRGENIYNSLARFTEAIGLKTVDPYFSDPSQAPPQPPKPDPKMIEAQAKLQIEAGKAQADAQLAQQKALADTEQKRAQMAADIDLERERNAAMIQLEREKAFANMELMREKAALEFQLSRERAALEAQLAMSRPDPVRPGGAVG